MRVRVRFKNKELAAFDLEDDSFAAPTGDVKGFVEIGRDKVTGKPVILHAAEVVAIEPLPDRPAA